MQAEKILAMVAKEAHAAGILSVQRTEPQLELVAALTGGAAQMTMHPRLAHHVSDSKDSLLLKLLYRSIYIYTDAHLSCVCVRLCIASSGLKRTASLARFLDKRKQRQEKTHAIIFFQSMPCHTF